MELIKITENNGQQVISARELHKGLEISKQFKEWFASNSKEFIENEDYIPLGIKANLTDYALTIDTAKHICLLSRTENGRKYRKYLIDTEKQGKQNIKLPTTYKEALLELVAKEDVIEKQQLLISEQTPKVIAFNKVIDNSATYTVASLSDAVDIGLIKLFEILRSWNWVLKKDPKGTMSSRYCEEQRYGKTLFETISINNRDITKKQFVLTRRGFEKAIEKLNK